VKLLWNDEVEKEKEKKARGWRATLISTKSHLKVRVAFASSISQLRGKGKDRETR
jgi:hypothetical protein